MPSKPPEGMPELFDGDAAGVAGVRPTVTEYLEGMVDANDISVTSSRVTPDPEDLSRRREVLENAAGFTVSSAKEMTEEPRAPILIPSSRPVPTYPGILDDQGRPPAHGYRDKNWRDKGLGRKQR